MNRRDFFLSSLATGSVLMLPSWARGQSSYHSLLPPDAPEIAPLQRLSSFGGSSEIEGDLQDEAHEIFWNKPGYIEKKGGIPAVSAHYDVVIVGGGLSGLSAAYYLKGKKALILEGHPRLGGNAKSQAYGKSYISQGSAYIVQQEDGDEIDQFLTSLKIKNSFRKVDHEEETVNLNGKFIQGFWKGNSDPARASEFKHVHEKFAAIYENDYPELPIWDDSASGRSRFNALDGITFKDWIAREFGVLHPHIAEYLTLYCWSSFSAAPSELSAAQALNFLTSDLAGTQVLPGGNGLISQAIYESLKSRSSVTLATNSFAVDIQSAGGKAVICYKNDKNELVTVTAADCIVASPKMVMKKVITGLKADQAKAMDDMAYRAYLVGNIFLDRKVASPGYDVFSTMGVNPTNEYNDSKNRVFADIVYADWALKDVAAKSVLTLYMPLPYDMAQQYLFVDNLHGKYLDRIKTRLIPALESMNLSWANVSGMRLVRYGHAMPLAQKNGVRSGMFETASRSIDNCIHFANQDNWGNPCFETAFGSALGVLKTL